MTPQGFQRPRNFRLKGVVVCDAMLRLCRLAMDIYGPDIERFVVYMAVISAGISHFQRDSELRARYADDAPLPNELRLGVSRRAIAESVGLPRETVRRKIKALIESGHVFEEDGLVKARGPVIDLDRNLEFLLGAMREVDRAAAALKRADEA